MEEITKNGVEIAESMSQLLDYVDIDLLMTNSKMYVLRLNTNEITWDLSV
jgi:hypothetical protein